MIIQTNRVIKVSTCWNGELTGSTVAHFSSSWTQHIQLTVLSYIHTHSYFNGSIREPLGLVSCPRIFGTQIGAARDRNKNHLLSGRSGYSHPMIIQTLLYRQITIQTYPWKHHQTVILHLSIWVEGWGSRMIFTHPRCTFVQPYIT